MTSDVVHVDELRDAMNRILTAVERTHGSWVAIADDYYWHLPVEDAYDMSQTPAIQQVGQISDDLAAIRQSLTDDGDVLAVWHDLSHVIGVLRVLEKLTLP